MAKKTRKTYDADFKAKVLAELSQSTIAAVAEKYELNPSNIRNWMELAGMVSPRKRRKNQPSAEQAEVLALVANRGKRTIASIAEEYGVSANTVSTWAKRYGLPAPAAAAAAANGAANGTHAKPSAPVLAIRNGAAVNPIVAIAEARALLTGILQQLDAISGAFQAFQAVFNVGTAPAPGTVGQA